jgi:MFS family permease
VRALIRRQLGEASLAFKGTFRNPSLRWLLLAWTSSVHSHSAYAVGVSIYAFKTGGTSAVGLVLLIRMIPAAAVSPFVSYFADRYPRERVMFFSDLVRVVLIGAAAIGVYAGAPSALIYVLTSLVAVAAAPFRPAQAAIVPSLARTPTELTAANLAASTVESTGFFVGPAVAGIVLAFASVGAVLLITAVGTLISALCISAIRAPRVEAGERRPRGALGTELAAGFRTIGGDQGLRIMVGLLSAITFVMGAFLVLVVPTAVDLLDMGTSGVGYLNSAIGIGALVGAVGAVSLVGMKRLAPPFVISIFLWGTPLILIAAWPRPAVALVLLAVLGGANTFVDVSGLTLVQRAVAEDVLARSFGVLEMLFFATTGLGAILAPPLVSWLGIRGALVVAGAVLPALVVAFGPTLLRIDAQAEAPGAELDLLRALSIFAPLPVASMEQVARKLIPLQVAAGTEVVRQGDVGDRFYIVESGEALVTVDGQEMRTLGPGRFFGEIALLRDVPRTATVSAATDLSLYALDREDFLNAVSGHAPSVRAAEAIMGSYAAE